MISTSPLRRKLRPLLHSLLLVAVMFPLAGCNLISLESFKLHGAKVLSLNFNKGALVEMTIQNNSLFNVTVAGGELAAYHKGEPIGQIYLTSPVKLPKRQTVTVQVEIGFRFSSPLEALKAVGALTNSPDDVTVSGYGEGKVWFLRKRFERRDVPLSKFITIFGAPTNYL